MSTNENDIVKLNLNDTFYDWYLRTNQIIDYVNPINVYDVFAGSGLRESRTGTPGTIELTVDTDPTLFGITTLVNTDGHSLVVLDYTQLEEGTVQNSTLYSIQNNTSQIFKIEASDMLPPVLNNDHTFNGVITVGDLIVNDGSIVLNNTGTDRDNCGLIVEGNDTDTSNVFFTYDADTLAWYSSENLGIHQNKGFVTNTSGDAIYRFIASETQAQIDLRLQTTASGIPERFSIFAEFSSPNILNFSHYTNDALANEILELQSTGSGSNVVIKDTIEIVDVLNSTPFTQVAETESIPVTDSTDGFLNNFVNRIKLPNNGAVVGDFVYVNSSGNATPTNASSLESTYQIGIVESIDGFDVVVILSGPFNGLLGGLSIGDVYYLSTTDGGVTNINPGSDTNGTIGKPVFVATSATSGVLISDFTDIGGGGVITVIEGGGGLTDAFKTITTLDDNNNIIETFTASGEDFIIFQEGSNIQFTTSTNKITISATSNVPDPTTADAYSILTSDSTTSFTYTGVDESSIVGRVEDGEIQSITLTERTLLGRSFGGNDSGVEALTPEKAREILGFSSNSYLKNVIFEDELTNIVYAYPDTDDGETLTIRAGNNISFEKIDGVFYINASGITVTSTDIVEEQSTDQSIIFTPLQVAISTQAYQDVEKLIFSNGQSGYIEFTKTSTSGSTTALISATPTNNYLKLAAGSTTSKHTAGGTLTLQGDKLNTSASLTGETFTIAVDTSITLEQINTLDNETEFYIGIAGRNNTTTSNASIILKDASTSTRGLESQGNDNSIIINAWDDYDDGVNRASSSLLHNKCVSIYADTTESSTSGIYSLPFKFYEIRANRIVVDTLETTTASKETEFLGTIIGNYVGDKIFNQASTIRYLNAENKDGSVLQFESPDDTTNRSFIFKPSTDFANQHTIPTDAIVIGNKLILGSTTDNTLSGPFLSSVNADALVLESQTSSSFMNFKSDDASICSVGVQGGTNGYGFIGYTDYSLRISETTTLTSETFIIENSAANGGYEFDTPSFIQADKGKLLFIDTVSNGKAKIGSFYVIKPYADRDPLDPINTLYYQTVV